MSTKRARYDGPHEEVAVFDSEAGIYAEPIAVVERGKFLPADVPARIRDELLASEWWSEVKQADQSPSDEKKEA